MVDGGTESGLDIAQADLAPAACGIMVMIQVVMRCWRGHAPVRETGARLALRFLAVRSWCRFLANTEKMNSTVFLAVRRSEKQTLIFGQTEQSFPILGLHRLALPLARGYFESMNPTDAVATRRPFFCLSLME